MKSALNNISIFLFSPYKRLILLLICVALVGQNHLSSQDNIPKKKINGISFNGPSTPGLNIQVFEDIKAVNANWITFVPEVVLNRATLELRSDSENHYWGRTLEGNIEGIKLAKEAGLKIMLKPQMVLDNVTYPSGMFSDLIKLEDLGGKIVMDKSDAVSWRGDFNPDNEEDWKKWEASYRKYILKLAKVSQEMRVDIFCLGTELRESTSNRPNFWIALISEVREVYSGILIYSANWDEYNDIDFWEHLDFLGVNSYFPISLLSTPSVKGVKRNWKFFRNRLKKFSKKQGKSVIITEFGYRNVSYAGLRPWIHDDGTSEINNQAQVNLYEAFFTSFWNEDWVIGGFSWNWDAVEKSKGNTDFSIQNKPAEEVLIDWYGR